MKIRIRSAALALLTASAFAIGLSTNAQAAASPSTPVHLSAAQVAQSLFVAGDVTRLSQIPSGTEDVVLEKVLQQLYVENPTLDSGQAASDIQNLQGVLTTGSQAISASTLTVMGGNQRVLAILRALTDSNQNADVDHALAQVTDHALTDASQSTEMLGQAFDASADSLDTISFASFAPSRVLAATEDLAATNRKFGQARDSLWKQASSESVFDDTKTLLGENPALKTDSIKSLTTMIGSDGSLNTTVGQLETLIRGSITQIDNQNCTLASGSSGASPSNCSSGALHDAQFVAAQCPNGTDTATGACTAARNQAQADATNELRFITSAQAAAAAEGDALSDADQALGQAETAEGQAAAEIADEENQYLDYQNAQQFEKAGFDVATLAVTLSVSEIDPVAAFSGLFNVVGDALGFSFSGPDPNTIILQGIQDISQQLSDFEHYTQSAFHAIDTQLANLSDQIAQDSYQLSVQLTQVQQQITQLASKLTTLQSSVDHLQSEVQSLFAQGAKNDLGTLINQDLGYQQANGVPLPQSQFAQAAGALYQDATSTALSSTVTAPPTGFNALNANGLVTAADPLSLDSNVNFFNLFGSQVTDSPEAIVWPGPLTSTCAAGADVQHGICLPDPDFWATSARAFAQLLTENPAYVTPTRLTQLGTIMQEGQVIANALHQLTANDAGSDNNGTGNQTLDAALNYYQYWGNQGHDTNAPPSLPQALHAEEQHYLDTTDVPGLSLPYSPIAPWGGNNQQPDLTGLLTLSSFNNVPLCTSEVNDGITGRINPNDYLIPHLTPSIIGFLPNQVLNAVRLGLGHVSTCWTATFNTPETASGGPFAMSLHFSYVGPNGTGVSDNVGSINATSSFEAYCSGASRGNQEIDAIDAVVAGCNDTNGLLGQSQFQTASYPADVSGYVEPAVNRALAVAQTGIYNDILSNGSTLTSGTSQATDVQSAAERLGGASAVLDGYVSLGLPQALASDDKLHSLISGVNADAFARTDRNLNLWGVQYADSVPDQVVNFYRAAAAAMPGFDPADFVWDLVQLRALAVTSAVRPYIVPPVAAQALARTAGAVPAASSGQALAQDNALISPTIDRLDETRSALSDALSHGASLFVSIAGSGKGTVRGGSIQCPGTCSHNYAAGTSVTLAATPAAGSRFAGWSGACSGAGTCTLALPYDQAVTATFISSPAAPGTSPAAPKTTPTPPRSNPAPAPPAARHPSARSAAKCTLRTSNRVQLATRQGRRPTKSSRRVTLSTVARCNQTAKLTLTGVLTQRPDHGHPRRRTFRLGPVSVRATAARPVTLKAKLPAGAVVALTRATKLSAVLRLTATNANGVGRSTTTIKLLRGF